MVFVTKKFKLQTFQKVILHPQYRPGGDKYHDIALIELEDEVTFSHNVWPACLNTEKQFQEDSDFIIAGFGKTNKIGRKCIPKSAGKCNLLKFFRSYKKS